MKNLTITQLSLFSVSNSPLLNLQQRIAVQKSFFARFSAPILRNPFAAKISSTSFKQGLSSAILVDAETYKDKVYNEAVKESPIFRQNPKEDEGIDVQFCTFTNMILAKQAPIYLKSKCKLFMKVSVQDTTFSNCVSAEYGAIYANVLQFSLVKTCFSGCKGEKQSVGSITTRAGFELDCNFTTYASCGAVDAEKSAESVLTLDGGILRYSNCNSTHNNLKAVAKKTVALTVVRSRGSIHMADSTFESNGKIPVLGLHSVSPFKVVERINFYDNEDTAGIASGLINIMYETEFRECILKQNKISAYFSAVDKSAQEDEQFLVRFINCQVDDEAPNTKDAFFFASEDQFGKTNLSTIELNLLNNAVCKGHVIETIPEPTIAPTTEAQKEEETKKSSTNWGFLSIFILIIVILALAAFLVLIYSKGENIPQCFKKFLDKNKKVPDYEVGLSDIQVAQEQE